MLVRAVSLFKEFPVFSLPESMPAVLSKTSLPCCAHVIPLFATMTGQQSDRKHCVWKWVGGDGLLKPPPKFSDVGSSLLPVHFHLCSDLQ